MPHRRFRVTLCAVIALALLAFSAPAGAATIAIDDQFDDEHLFTGDSGEVSNVIVTANGLSGDDEASDTVTFQDLGGDLLEVDANDQDRCTGDGTSAVTCTGGDVYSVRVRLGDENDTAELRGNFDASAEGDDGDDRLTGSDQAALDGEGDFLEGGDGVDRISGRGGDDEVIGGLGGDIVDAGAGRDTINDTGGEGTDNYAGGAGFDELDYDGSDDSPDDDIFAVDFASGRGGRTSATPELDSITGIEDTSTDGGNDRVTGSASPNFIDTEFGDDVIDAGGGTDTVRSEEGNDTLLLRDGVADRGLCGEGVDTVQADQFDTLDGCENVSRAVLRPAGADVVAPACTVKRVRARLGRTAFFRGIRPDVDCNEAAKVEMQLVAVVKRGAFTAAIGDLVLAQKTTAAGTDVRLTPGKRFARVLRKNRGIRARLIVEAQDEYGNRSVIRRGIKVKRAPKPKVKRRKRGGR